MVYIPPGPFCFDIVDIDLSSKKTEIKFCDHYEDGPLPRCILKDVNLDDGIKICNERKDLDSEEL